MTDTQTQPTEIVTIKQPSIHDFVNAVVSANGNLPLAVERLNRKGIAIDTDNLIATLAADPTADELLSKQLRMKAKLTTYQMLMTSQADLLASIGDSDQPLSAQGSVQIFSAIASLFNSLTDQRGVQPVTGNIFERMLTSITDPNVREAITTLALTEPTPPAPTPIRKRGRPPGSRNGTHDGVLHPSLEDIFDVDDKVAT